MTDEHLHVLAREIAGTLVEPDRKQLRFNEIVEASKRFYVSPEEGVRELVSACDKSRAFINPDGSIALTPNEMYVPKQPMWKALNEQYSWAARGADQ